MKPLFPLRRAARRLVLAALFGALARAAHADPNDYVLTLDYVQGEREVDAKLGAGTRAPNGTPAAQAGALAWGAGLGDDWFTEIYAQFSNSVSATAGGGFDSLSWENVVRFAEPGQWPVDVGAVAELERSRDASQGWKLTAGPMLQTDLDQIQINVNLLLARAFDATVSTPTRFGYQFQVKVRAQPYLEYGLQGLRTPLAASGAGAGAAHADQVGPAVFGRLHLAPGRSVNYNAAVLMGTASGAPTRTVRAQIDYEY